MINDHTEGKGDGDEMNGMVAIDEFTYECFEKFSSKYSLFDSNVPRKISGVAAPVSSIVSRYGNWLHEQQLEADELRKQMRAN